MARATASSLTRLLRALGVGKHPWARIATLIAGLFGGGWWLWDNQQATKPVESANTPTKGSTLTCNVKTVYDGDTMNLICPKYGLVKVRVWGIDAPEMAQDPWGERARDNLRRIAQGEVRLKVVDIDRYGRVVGRVFVGNKELGLEQVVRGYVNIYSQYNKEAAYYQAREQAQQKKLGIWAKAGLHQTPWEWRRQNRS